MLIDFREASVGRLRDLAPTATAVVPLGSTEQHGPHLPVGTDSIIVRAIVDAAARRVDDIPIVALPPLEFGFAHHHLPFGGTISVEMTHYSDVLADVGASVFAAGFRRLVFVNGHGGNDSPLREALDRIVFERHAGLHVAGASYWDAAAVELGPFAEYGPVPGHAGWFETSCMLALRPDLVRLEALSTEADTGPRPLVASAIRGAVVRRPDVWMASEGRTDDALAADAGLGRRILDAAAGGIGRLLTELHESVL